MKAAIVLSLALAGLGLAVPTADVESRQDVESSQDAEMAAIFCIPKCKALQIACEQVADKATCEIRYQQCKCKCKKGTWDPKTKTCSK